MLNGPRRVALVSSLLGLAAGLAAIPAPGGRADGAARLRAMPIEQRRALAQNLARFDRLGPGEREALLKLDAQLAALDDGERARYLDLLRRYHLWMRTLTAEQRQALADASEQRSLALIHQYREEASRAPGSARHDAPIWTMSTVFNPATIDAEAVQVRRWQALTSAQREEVARLPSERDQVRRLNELTRDLKIRRNLQALHAELETLRERFNADVEKHNAEAKANRREPRKKFAELDEATRAKLIRALEYRHFHEQMPPEVEPGKLVEFDSELPPWIRERIAWFPPEAARWRLMVLHFLAHTPPAAEAPPRPNPAAGRPRHPPPAPSKGPAAPRD